MKLTSHFVTIAASLVALGGCAPDSGLDGAGGSGGGLASTGTSSANGGSSSDGGSTGNGFETGSGGSTGTNMMECGTESIEAQLSPLTMFIAFDKSGSMGDAGKWTNATNALKSFFGDPGAADLEVALRFFPDDGCDGFTCNIDACATPLVPPAPLTIDPAPTDAQEAALVDAVNSNSPNGGTPMSAALEGGIQFSTQYLAAHPDHKVVVILVTDGEPNGCIEDIGGISNIAATGLADGVVTYTVGLQGSNEAQLAQIAISGGGSSFVIGNGNTQQDLIAALQAIRGEQLACELALPTPTNGMPLDPNLVNVTYTPGMGGAPQTFGKVADEAACGSGQTWYYDDPVNPTKIILCPTACDAVRGDADGKLEVVLGCQSIPG